LLKKWKKHNIVQSVKSQWTFTKTRIFNNGVVSLAEFGSTGNQITEHFFRGVFLRLRRVDKLIKVWGEL